ncbi:permease [Paenibacillus sp.]|uniref:permease n=1 Tax=Paenibacillus sp. TaxID=58172 RepID=UPI002D354E09|nr:permease [Paenibacillus sp.]HZG85913.1 permease [Paenibacillus sp.]
MFAGHFGVAAIVKARHPEVPLWALLTATQLPDLAFLPLTVAGVESIESTGYGKAVIDAMYTHSLLGALLLSLIAGLAAAKAWGKRSGIVVGAVAFSHWLLDLLVHRPDLPIVPGNIGGFPLLGLGLWNIPAASAAVEAVLVLSGAVLYWRSVHRRGNSSPHRWKAHASGAAMAIVLCLSLLSDIMGGN